MEKKNMLRFLMYIQLFIVNVSYANSLLESLSEDDINWARSLSKQGMDAFANEVKKTINKPWFDKKLQQRVMKPRPALQIFVSSSMPKPLLKAYSKEAKKYDGALVLSGLPNGSVREFAAFVMEISYQNTAPLQIDDEAFRAFDITAVPTIVLAENVPIFNGKTSSKKFDKIVGAIKVRAALEKFANDGEMSDAAWKLLR